MSLEKTSEDKGTYDLPGGIRPLAGTPCPFCGKRLWNIRRYPKTVKRDAMRHDQHNYYNCESCGKFWMDDK